MMKKVYIPILCIVFLTTIITFVGNPCFAQTEAEGDKSPWNSEAEIGYLMTSGNTETQSLNFQFNITRDAPRWRHNVHFETLYSSETSEETGKEETTAQRFLFSTKSNYKFDPRNSVFLMGIYEDDRFSGYEYQYTIAAGYSRLFVKTERMELSGEAGPGYRYSKIDDDTLAAADDEEEEKEAIAHIGGFFQYNFNSAVKFTQEISVDAGEKKTITRSTTSLKSQIADNLAMKISYSIKQTSTVPPDTDKTDTVTALNLVYSF